MTETPSCIHCGLPVPAGRRDGDGPAYCCFGCRLAREIALPAATAEAGKTGPPTTLLLRLGLGIFLALNIMVASWVPYSRDLFGGGTVGSEAESALFGLASYLALFLCTIVVALLGLPLAADSLLTRARRVDAQLLIVIGVFSAYGLSIWHTLRGEGSLYFDTAANVLVVVSLGAYLEAGARQRATASAHRLLAALPRTVRVERSGGSEEIALEDVTVGDLVTVLPGETVPVDGRLTEGASRVDESGLTGEPWARAVEAGDRLLAGSLNREGRIRLTAERVAGDTVLAVMERSLEKARGQRPPIQRLADRVAAIFVPTVVALALGLFAIHAFRGEVATGLLRSLSVLLISCPCALGLAAPLACWHGLRRAAESGILVDSPATLERMAAVERVFFDKTGTLTRPEPRLDRIEVEPGVGRDWALAAAAGLESASPHPIARAVVEDARRSGIEPAAVTAAVTVPGRGVEGRVDGRLLRLGSRRWAAALGLTAAEDGERAEVLLMGENALLASFELEEAERPDAGVAAVGLRSLGVGVAILSGDGEVATQRLATRLGVDGEGALLPDDKVERLEKARQDGTVVAMVGDGLNDSPVLAAADVGIAVASASDLAKSSGNVRLISDRLDRIPRLTVLARDVRRRIRANLAFAFGFNTVGIGLAASGLLSPLFAAVAMVVSSLAVVRISSRAGRVEPGAAVPARRQPAPVSLGENPRAAESGG